MIIVTLIVIIVTPAMLAQMALVATIVITVIHANIQIKNKIVDS